MNREGLEHPPSELEKVLNDDDALATALYTVAPSTNAVPPVAGVYIDSRTLKNVFARSTGLITFLSAASPLLAPVKTPRIV